MAATSHTASPPAPKETLASRGVVHPKRLSAVPNTGPKSQLTPRTGVVVYGLNVVYSAEFVNAALRAAFEEAVEDYLELCRTQGIEPEVPFKGSFNVRVGAELHRRVAVAAKRKNTSLNKFVAEALEKATNRA